MATTVKPNSFAISSFVAAIDRSGARSNLFEVDIVPPTSIKTALSTDAPNTTAKPETQWRFLVNATTLPGYTNAEIPVSYYGRTVYFSGDTTFGDWTVTVLNDESMQMRKSVEMWMEQINSTVENVRIAGIQHSNIAGTAKVKTFGMKGVGSTVDGTLAAAQGTKGVTQVEMFDVWPSNISPIDLSQDAANTIETFQVTWQYNYLSHSNS